MNRLLRMSVLGSLMMSAGCFDYEARREFDLSQAKSTLDANLGEFEVDTSQIPSDWIKERSSHYAGGADVDCMTLAMGKHVKIMIVPVPDTQPSK